MSEAPVTHDNVDDDSSRPPELSLAPESVVIRRNAGLAALLGVVASGVAIGYLARASESGAVLDWVLAAVLGLLGVGHLTAFVDARTPLLVADSQGVRIRLGRAWRGLPWGALSRVEHTPRRGLLRDGRLVMVVHNPARLVEELERGARRQARVSQRLYGAPFALPLGLATRVTGDDGHLTAALAALAGDRSRVVEMSASPAAEEPAEGAGVAEGTVPELAETQDQAARPESTAVEPAGTSVDVAESDPSGLPDASPKRPLRLRLRRRSASDPLDGGAPKRGLRGSDPRPAVAHAIVRASDLFKKETHDDEDAVNAEPEITPSETPSPLRDPASASRVEVRRKVEEPEVEESAGRELRRPGSVSLVEDTVVWGDRVLPIAREGQPVEPLLIDDFTVEPAEDPVIGPELAAARTRLGLTVDQLAERTRIRPHVIESIEVDDFAPCGGDFYARGHLRTLARVLGTDVAPLLSAYNDRYADAPINPRRVFEAELASGSHGPIRGTRGGPNWSVLVAAVMAMVLVWSVARLLMDSPTELQGTTPVLNGSAGVHNGNSKTAPPVPVVLTAAGGGARVVVRDGTGKVVFTGNLAFGESKSLQVSPPIRVQSTDGSLTATIDGEDRGALGKTGEPAQNTFIVSE